MNNKIDKKIFDNRKILGVIYWYLTNPHLLHDLAKYLICRKTYLQFINGINGKLAEGNRVPTNRIIKVLEENDFNVELKNYGGWGQLLRGARDARVAFGVPNKEP